MDKPTRDRLAVISHALKKSARRNSELRPAQLAAEIDETLASQMPNTPTPRSTRLETYLSEYRKLLSERSTAPPGKKSQLEMEEEAEERLSEAMRRASQSES
jgi:hypothetical protein